MSLSHILAPAPQDESGPKPAAPENTTPSESMAAAMPPTPAHDRPDEHTAETPRTDPGHPDDQISPNTNEPMYTATTTSTRRNASGSVSSVYSGNKIRHLKKEDGIPLWRKDIQYDFLRLVFFDQTKCFTKYSDGSKDHTFAEIYIDAMAKSSKCSKILKEKLLQDTDGAICMAMVCLLVNVGRMNTTLNFFPEMRAQLRTYHSIPALQAHQDPNAYKQLQDAPRLKSILKGATEDEPQPSTIEEIKDAKAPRTNPVNLVFVMSQYAPKVSEVHFPAPRDFFDLVMRPSLSSASRAKAFLWLTWWYLESDFSKEDALRNPFGPGQFGEGEQDSGALPLKVPSLESLTEEQAAAENIDTEEEKHYGEVKRKERIAILASEPSPAMTALKRARKEKGLTSHGPGMHSEDEASEVGWSKQHYTPGGRSIAFNHETGSDYTRSPSPAASRPFNSVNSKSGGDMRINNLLNNDDAVSESSPPRGSSLTLQSSKKGPGRGNWRRNKGKGDASTPSTARGQDDRSHHVPLLPNPGQLSFINEGPTTTSSGSYRTGGIDPYLPTPSYQAQKRHRGITQHQSAVLNHRKQQIDYTLDRRIRKVHSRARGKRELEGSLLRAWKRIRLVPTEYDSEEEKIKARRATDKDDSAAAAKGKENVAEALDDFDAGGARPRVHLAGFARMPGEPNDVGEEARAIARAFRRCSRRLERWGDNPAPGAPMIRRRQMEAQGPRYYSGRRKKGQEGKMELEEDGGGGELDDEDRELLGEVDADASEEEEEEEGEDEEMEDD